MNNPRKYIKTVLISFMVLVIGLLGYLYYPQILGDILYPLEYESYIIKYSEQFDIDPTLIAAIIYAESRYNPEAGSHAGAQGLMQIMPNTGKAIASRLGEDFGDLFDPETSIRYGTYYIDSLVEKYNGDVESALAAYNGGFVAADRYVITRSFSDIPLETAGYLQKVTAAQKMYAQIYGNILYADNVAEALKIEQQEEEKTWVQKILSVFGFGD